MSEVPLASVVVPTRNRAALLRDCLQSLRIQDYPPERYEIVVVDDGSVDATAAVVAAVGRSGPPATVYVPERGRGLNPARNAGIAAARGDRVCFVDDDVEAPPTWLGALAAGMDRHPEAGCFGGPIRLRLEGRPPRMCSWERLGETELDLGPDEIPVETVYGANMAVRRSALERVGRFDESLPLYGDETEWNMRYRRAGGIIWYVPGAWLWHRRTADQLRFRALVRSRFRQGLGHGHYLWRAGAPAPLRGALLRMALNAGHAARRGCPLGCLAAVRNAGEAWGTLAAAWRTPRRAG